MVNDKIKAFVSLISSLITKDKILAGGEIITKTLVRDEIQKELIKIGFDGYESFKKDTDLKIKIPQNIYKFMKIYSKYLTMTQKDNWGHVVDLLLKSSDFEQSWNIVWKEIKKKVSLPVKESSGFSVILNLQNMINLSETSIPQWTSMKDTRKVLKSFSSKDEAKLFMETKKPSNLALRDDNKVIETIIGWDIIPNNLFETVEEETTDEDVFFQNMIQKSGKKIDETFMDSVLDLRRRAGISESIITKLPMSFHDMKNIMERRMFVSKKPVFEVCDRSKVFNVAINALRKNSHSEPSRVLRALADKKYHNIELAEDIASIIKETSGISLYEFSKFIKENLTENFSPEAMKWVKKRVEELYPSHIKDKGEAFGRAWNEWKKAHK